MLSFFTNRNLIIGLVVIFLIGAGWMYVQSLKIKILECTNEKKSLQNSLIISQESVKQLQNAIDEQNLAIEKFKSDADRRVKEGQVILDKAKQEAKVFKNRAEELLSQKPTPGKSLCESADELINKEIRNEK